MALKTFYSDDVSTGSSPTAFCSGRTYSATALGNIFLCSETATDLINRQAIAGSSETNVAALDLECRPAVANWASGTYGVSVNVTTANMNLTLTEIHLCRINSSNAAVATIGSLTGIARNLGTTGSVTHNVTGSASNVSATDKLIVVFVVSNAAMSNQSASFETTIATPIDSAPATSSPPWYGTHRPQFRTPKRRII